MKGLLRFQGACALAVTMMGASSLAWAQSEATPAAAAAPAPAEVVRKSTVEVSPANVAMCSKTVKPVLPSIRWRGNLTYRITVKVVGDQVTGVTFRAGRREIDGDSAKALVSAFETAVKAYACKGDGEFEQQVAYSIVD
jgi:hypothetical protein